MQLCGPSPAVRRLEFTGLRPLGEVGGVLLLSAKDGVVGLDRAAAQRRVAYDRLARGEAGVAPATPARVDLDADGEGALDRCMPALVRMGWRLEPFGGRTWVVQAAPRGVTDPVGTLRAVLAVGPEGALEACASGVAPEPELAEVLAALDRVEHVAPKATPFAFALTADELRRMLRSE